MHLYDDDTLIALLRSSDRKERDSAFTYIYEKFYSNIARFVMDNSGTREDVKDLFQDGVIVIYEKVQDQNFVLTNGLRPFLFAVCKNIWLKRLRKASNREIPIDNIHQFPLQDIPFEDPFEDQKNRLGSVMKQLGDDCRKTLLLFYFERLSMKEIAARMNLLNEKVAKNKKARCLAKLRELFKQSKNLKN